MSRDAWYSFTTKMGKESFMEKYVFRLVTSVGQRKNSESLWGIEPKTFCFRVLMLYNWAAETTVSEVYYEVHMRRVLHTARISNVDSVMFVNRIRDMVSFKTYHLCNSIYESFILYFKSTHFFFFLFFLSFLVEAKEPKFAGTLYVIVNGIAIIILHFAKPIMQQKIVRGLAIFAIVW